MFNKRITITILVDLLTPRSLIKANANTNINSTTLIVTTKIFLTLFNHYILQENPVL